MYYELLDTALLTNNCNEVDNIFPFVKVVNSESALNSHRDVHYLNHALAYVGYQVRIKHQSGTKTSCDSFVTWAAAVQIYFIKPSLFNYFGSF